MTDVKKSEESASGDGAATEAGREIADGQLEGVAGGSDNRIRCPYCGSLNYEYDGANHMMICHDCMG